MIVSGFAKLNLSLQVRARDASGFHPLRSLVQSVGWADDVALEGSDEDVFTVAGDLQASDSNLAWLAADAVRRRQGVRAPMAMHLEKRIAVAAGLGGGSADAAAALVAAGDLLGAPAGVLEAIAPELGSDVPFCLMGGSAWVEGRGERLVPARLAAGWSVAVAVPPFELSTAAVYRRWDELDGPGGVATIGRHLPPALREHAPLVNDLLPAALDLRPELGDWMSGLRAAWQRAVLLTGSGPGVFAFFADDEEATDALGAVSGARALWAGGPVGTGTSRLS